MNARIERRIEISIDTRIEGKKDKSMDRRINRKKLIDRRILG